MPEIITDEKILHQVSRNTSWEEVGQLQLVQRIKEALPLAWTKGCGLAAIQIGAPLSFAWFIFNGKEECLLNPVIITRIGYHKDIEGCLSIPNKRTEKMRAYEIEYMSDGKKKRAKGLKARIIQHEIDHMNGILNID